MAGDRPGRWGWSDGPKKESLAESLVRTEEGIQDLFVCFLDACSDQRGMGEGG